MVLSEDSWETLLQFIDDGQVIPIVGPELLYVKQGDDVLLLEQLWAKRLAESLEVTIETMPRRGALNHVACLYLESPKPRRQKIYSQLGLLASRTNPEVPEGLRKLAQIRHFNLFVSMTTDLLLEKALFEARKTTPDVIVYNLGAREVDDLPRQRGCRPIVFHLMGRMSLAPDYVVTEEDLLEFLHAMQSGRRPKLLFDELRNHHLLFIGCDLTNWLARFFMRMAKGAPLSAPSNWQEIIVDPHIAHDGELTAFLAHFAPSVEVIPAGGAIEFVDELLKRYLKRHLGDDHARNDVQQASPRPKVFLSYAHEDHLTAGKLVPVLESLGVDVWWDRGAPGKGLDPGDDWNAMIQKQIRDSKLFLPMVSRNTEERMVGYFRREWNWAVEHANSIFTGLPFITPIVIDDLDIRNAKVPSAFVEKQACLLPGGDPDHRFVESLRRLLACHQKLEMSAL
ncbi:MAG TPA: toll/interleukin-1 receptor domain-containing protein [Pirellulales bacterium]|nr:toll/interleukin-1 receptor domain-containing protein [Pirellulales bacterium]